MSPTPFTTGLGLVSDHVGGGGGEGWGEGSIEHGKKKKKSLLRDLWWIIADSAKNIEHKTSLLN